MADLYEEYKGIFDSTQGDLLDPLLQPTSPTQPTASDFELKRALGRNPDQAVESQRLSQSTGLPESIVDKNKDTLKQQELFNEYSNLLETSPATHEFLSNPANAAVAHDDMDNLVEMEDLFKLSPLYWTGKAAEAHDFDDVAVGIWDSFSPLLDANIGGGMSLMGDDLFESDVGRLAAVFMGMQQQLTGGEEAVQVFADKIKEQKEQLSTDGVEIAAQAFIDLQEAYPDIDPDSAAGYAYDIGVAGMRMAPVVAASVLTRNPLAGMALMSSDVYTNKYAEGITSGMSNEDARRQALIYTGFEVFPEVLPLGIVINKGKGLLSRLLLTSAAEGVTEQMTEILSIGYEVGVLNDDITWGEGWERIKRAGIVGAFLGGGMTGTAGIVETATQRTQSIEEATAYYNMMNAVAEMAPNLMLAARSSEKFGQFVAPQIEKAGIDAVYISTDALDTYAAEQGLGRQDIYTVLGIEMDLADLEQARLTGQEIKLTPEQFGKIVAEDQQLFTSLKDKWRYGEDALTFEETQVVDEAAEDTGEAELVEPETVRTTAPTILAENSMGLQAFFQDAAEAGMTAPEYTKYLETKEQGRTDAVKKIEARKLRVEKTKLSKQWKAKEVAAIEEAKEHLSQQPVYQAFNAIGRERLNRQQVLDLLGGSKELLDSLPKQGKRSIYTNANEKGGLDPQLVAQLAGFDSADIMLFQMIDNPSLDAAARAEAQNILMRNNPEMAAEMNAIDVALEELHNDAHASALAMELNALRKARKQKALKKRDLARMAKAQLRKAGIEDISPKKFMKASKRYGVEARKALRKGDYATASKAKFRQLLNFEMAMESFALTKEIQKQRKYLASWFSSNNHPSMAPGFVQLIRDQLGAYNLGTRMSTETARNLIDRAYLRAAQNGSIFIMPERVRKNFANKHWRDLSYGEFEELHNGIKNVEAQGKIQKSITVKEELKDYIELVDTLLTTLDERPDLARIVEERTQYNPSMYSRATSFLAGLDAGARRVEFLIQNLDNREITGLWYDVLFRKLADAGSNHADLIADKLAPLSKEIHDIDKKNKGSLSKDVYVPSLNRTFKRSNLIIMALNSGNESNLDKMIRGSHNEASHPVPLTIERVMDALSLLTPEEGAWVQKVWDTFEEIYPEVQRIFEQEHGTVPKKIIPFPIEIGGEVRKGGYFPMMYDHSKTADRGIDPTDALEAMQQRRSRESVFAGMTEARTEGYADPVSLDFNRLQDGLSRTLYYVTHYEAVRDVNRIMKNRQISEALRNKMGPEYLETLQDWLRSVATDGMTETALNAQWRQAIEALRNNVTVAVMGASVTTTLSQQLGMATSIASLGRNADGSFSNKEGIKWMTIGLNQYARAPMETTEFVRELSGEMRHRINNTDRDIRSALNKVSGMTGKGRTAFRQIQKMSLTTIAAAQFFGVDMPTWVGAYNKALAGGRSTEDAVQYADSIVRTSQGSGAIKDLPKWQRERGAYRWFTMFSTYLFTLYNLQAQNLGTSKQSFQHFIGGVSTLIWLTVVPAMADALLRNEAPDEDEDPATWFTLKTTAYMSSAIPIIGPWVSSSLEGYSPSLSPVDSVPEYAFSWVKEMVSMVNGEKEWDERTWKKLALGAGFVVGAPGTIQASRFFDALAAMEEGYDVTWYDFLIGYKDD